MDQRALGKAGAALGKPLECIQGRTSAPSALSIFKGQGQLTDVARTPFTSSGWHPICHTATYCSCEANQPLVGAPGRCLPYLLDWNGSDADLNPPSGLVIPQIPAST